MKLRVAKQMLFPSPHIREVVKSPNAMSALKICISVYKKIVVLSLQYRRRLMNTAKSVII